MAASRCKGNNKVLYLLSLFFFSFEPIVLKLRRSDISLAFFLKKLLKVPITGKGCVLGIQRVRCVSTGCLVVALCHLLCELCSTHSRVNSQEWTLWDLHSSFVSHAHLSSVSMLLAEAKEGAP